MYIYHRMDHEENPGQKKELRFEPKQGSFLFGGIMASSLAKSREKAIRLIRSYKRDIDVEYSWLTTNRNLYYKWASRWAINDLLEYVMSNPDMHAINLVEEYARRMDNYACRNKKGSYVFSIANDVAVGVLDMLYSHL